MENVLPGRGLMPAASIINRLNCKRRVSRRSQFEPRQLCARHCRRGGVAADAGPLYPQGEHGRLQPRPVPGGVPVRRRAARLRPPAVLDRIHRAEHVPAASQRAAAAAGTLEAPAAAAHRPRSGAYRDQRPGLQTRAMASELTPGPET